MSVRSSSSGGHLLSTAGRHDLEPPCELLSGFKDPGMISKLIRQVKSYFGRYGSRVGRIHALCRLYKGDFALIFFVKLLLIRNKS